MALVESGTQPVVKQSEYSSLKVIILTSPAGKISASLPPGAVVHSVLCWDTPIPGASRKKGGGRDVSIAPFQKQLAYSREGGGLEDVKIRLHRTMDPVRLKYWQCHMYQSLSLSLP